MPYFLHFAACIHATNCVNYPNLLWRGGRVAEGNGLLNRRTTFKLYRGFESRPLRLEPKTMGVSD